MHILNIAEKPSIAKSVAAILSNNRSVKSTAPNKFTPYHKFKYGDHDFTFTAVLGHLFSYTAGEQVDIWREHSDIYKRVFRRMNNREYQEPASETIRWTEEGALQIYDQTIHMKMADRKIINTLKCRADIVIIWTDNDREGEHIAREIADIIGESYGLTNYHRGGIISSKEFDLQVANRDRKIFANKASVKFKLSQIADLKKYKIFRARFNSLSKEDLLRALDNITLMDYDMVSAVDTRIEMDMRSGFALTRIFTIYLKKLLSAQSVISYGQCQIPTLGFIVDRYLQFKNFIPEKFYFLLANLDLKFIKNPICECYEKEIIPGIISCKWDRVLFDKNCTLHFLQKLSNIEKKDIKISRRDLTVQKPLPLRTTTLMKAIVSKFSISSFQAMEICEKLYTSGHISYPRTETDIYPPNFNFNEILSKFSNWKIKKQHGVVEFQKTYEICEKIHTNLTAVENKFRSNPRMGRNNDQSHLPIYPIKPYTQDNSLESKIFHFIYTEFLATVHVNGLDEKYTIDLLIAGEKFTAEHRRIKKLGFREIALQKVKLSDGYEIAIGSGKFKNLEIEDDITKPLPLLTEPALITLMDQNGIGTDATIHEHIKKVQDRRYCFKEKNAFHPSNIGLSLVNGCMKILSGGEEQIILHKPYLRSAFEKKLTALFDGTISKSAILTIEKNMYIKITNEIIRKKQDFLSDVVLDLPSTLKKDSIPTSTSKAKRKKTGPPTNRANNRTSIKCFCGKETIKLISNTERNKNRPFLSCSNKNNDRCNFFQWYD